MFGSYVGYTFAAGPPFTITPTITTLGLRMVTLSLVASPAAGVVPAGYQQRGCRPRRLRHVAVAGIAGGSTDSTLLAGCPRFVTRVRVPRLEPGPLVRWRGLSASSAGGGDSPERRERSADENSGGEPPAPRGAPMNVTWPCTAPSEGLTRHPPPSRMRKLGRSRSSRQSRPEGGICAECDGRQSSRWKMRDGVPADHAVALVGGDVAHRVLDHLARVRPVVAVVRVVARPHHVVDADLLAQLDAGRGR